MLDRMAIPDIMNFMDKQSIKRWFERHATTIPISGLTPADARVSYFAHAYSEDGLGFNREHARLLAYSEEPFVEWALPGKRFAGIYQQDNRFFCYRERDIFPECYGAVLLMVEGIVAGLYAPVSGVMALSAGLAFLLMGAMAIRYYYRVGSLQSVVEVPEGQVRSRVMRQTRLTDVGRRYLQQLMSRAPDST